MMNDDEMEFRGAAIASTGLRFFVVPSAQRCALSSFAREKILRTLICCGKRWKGDHRSGKQEEFSGGKSLGTGNVVVS